MELLQHTTLQRFELQMELGEPLPQILGDPSSIGNALMNLCVNAIDAMPEKGVLRFRTLRTDSGLVELMVEDTGQGMTGEVLARATEPFFTTKPTGKGTGLGLSGVYGTMKAHGGSMEIQSAVGKGTRVMLRFPAAAGLPGLPVHSSAGPSSQKTERAMKILLVDDDELIRDSFPDLMEILGHQVVATAPSGNDAIRRIEEGLAVDVIVLDHNMPGLSGIETLIRLQSLRPGLPIVFCSGHLEDSVRERLQGCRRVWTLMKPYSIKDIRQILSEMAQG
jgi:CheY-like chemotaxis protein